MLNFCKIILILITLSSCSYFKTGIESKSSVEDDNIKLTKQLPASEIKNSYEDLSPVPEAEINEGELFNINPDRYLAENFNTAELKEILYSTFPQSISGEDQLRYQETISNFLEYYANGKRINVLLHDNNLKISFELLNSFSIIDASLEYCREFFQEFTFNKTANFSHHGIACRDNEANWILLKRKI